jgi:hypothetical protein
MTGLTKLRNAVRVFPPAKADKVPAGPDWLHEIKSTATG